MEEKKLQSELAANCKQHGKQLSELLKAYELACLGYDMQEQRCKDVYNRVLAENEFFIAKNTDIANKRSGNDFHDGDRVTSEEYMFMLSDEDFNKVLDLATPIFVAEKITDEEGCFIENWTEMRSDSRNELVNFIIQNVIPAELRGAFYRLRHNVVQQQKLIDIVKGAFA